MSKKYCSECGTQTIKKIVDGGYFDKYTGKRKTEKIDFCPNVHCFNHRTQLEDYFCPIKINTGEHEYSHGLFGFLNPHCSGCGMDNSYMGG